jgi:hypothetical protein
MPTSFRMPFQVMRRNMGYWQNGVYKIDDEVGALETIMATVQMPSTGDLMKIETLPYGKRAGRYIKIYTDTRLNCVNQEIEGLRNANPGDIFYYDGSQYLLFGESDFTMLSRSRNTGVSHFRYYACELMEGYVAEQIA